ncbi:MAG: methylenetetrahydrofolate--tRNA-(uracil(54)-C(5))-methyltransferase (FADH(2)-oxidizing) TrmFO [Firmicutes bacterium]|nr:methylenetetrahydrofolate--tRNA-(uracil(54)-C(5))-methyltransferase (FADH(2)-oxidizing) TrmFO [Bacillota bacterium]
MTRKANGLTVVGAGLAGSEAAWQAAQRGVPVTLIEMRPQKLTPAHHTGFAAELVCSNSLRSASLDNAVGLLKEEMRQQGSLIMEAALANQVPAGGALAVDRDAFARHVTQRLREHPLIDMVQQEVQQLPEERPVVIATGPLTSSALADSLQGLLGSSYLHFYDAAAPIVTAESIDWDRVYLASRYGKGEADYVNCPLQEDEYAVFYQALITAETQPLREFEKEIYFEGCVPIEALAKRGYETLLYGPLKPIGLPDPRTGQLPYAVVQLRRDNRAGTLYNMVGFQTNLKWPEQRRVWRLIPGLERAEFARYGVMHRNTFINSPELLLPTLQWRQDLGVFFAGQLTGVEGYVESAASGLVAGINGARIVQGQEPLVFPQTTAHGALLNYITSEPKKNFQPMNIAFGLFPALDKPPRGKRARAAAYAQRALQELRYFLEGSRI